MNDSVRFDQPQWLVEPPSLVAGKRVLIVDEICGSGETIGMVKAKLEEMGVVDVRSAVLYAHSWGVGVPDYIGIISDALIFNPWDREILRDGQFIFHPEYSEALRHQALLPDESMLIEAEHFSLAKLKP